MENSTGTQLIIPYYLSTCYKNSSHQGKRMNLIETQINTFS